MPDLTLPHLMVPVLPVADAFGFPAAAAAVFFAHLYDARYSPEDVACAAGPVLERLEQLWRPGGAPARCSARLLLGTLDTLEQRVNAFNWPASGPLAGSPEGQAWGAGKAFHHARFLARLAIRQCQSRGGIPTELTSLDTHLRRSAFRPAIHVGGRDHDLSRAAAAAVEWIGHVRFGLEDERDGLPTIAATVTQPAMPALTGQPEPDGVYPPRRLRVGGVDFPLTAQQLRIWTFFDARPVARLDEIMARGSAVAVWQERYGSDKIKQTQKMRKALSELTAKLVDAGVSFRVAGEHVSKVVTPP